MCILGKTLLSSQHNLSLLFWHQVTARAVATAWGLASAQEKSFQPCQVCDDCSKVVSEEEEKKEEKEDQPPPPLTDVLLNSDLLFLYE